MRTRQQTVIDGVVVELAIDDRWCLEATLTCPTCGGVLRLPPAELIGGKAHHCPCSTVLLDLEPRHIATLDRLLADLWCRFGGERVGRRLTPPGAAR